jgi:hypothetical protein
MPVIDTRFGPALEPEGWEVAHRVDPGVDWQAAIKGNRTVPRNRETAADMA